MALDFLFGEWRPRSKPRSVERVRALDAEVAPNEGWIEVTKPLKSVNLFFYTSPASKCDWILLRYDERLTRNIKLGSKKRTQLIRQLLKMASDPFAVRKLTLRFSSMDQEFLGLIQSGDSSRDQEKWTEAEYYYWMALQLYPKHPGYIVQYAHALKEQGKFSDAALYYHEAIALGESVQNVKEHLYFTISRAGLPVLDRTLASIEHFWKGKNEDRFNVPPTQEHVISMTELLMNRLPVSNSEIYRWLARASTLRDLVFSMLREPEFVSGHRDFLRLIAERLERKQ